MTGEAEYVLFKEFDGREVTVELPLTSNVDVEEMRNDLGIPKYVDLGYFPMRRAIATLWAARNAHKLNSLYPALKDRVSKEPLDILLFGGGAVKILCPSANDRDSPLNRNIKDVDLIVSKKHGSRLCNLLSALGEIFGTEYLHFITKSDRFFNAMRHGDRYRVRAIDEYEPEGAPVVGFMDIFADEIDLRHKISCKDELKEPEENLYTIGPEKMILSKCQFIMEVSEELLPDIRESNLEYRLLPYEHYKGGLLLGMEAKDMKDVFTLFLDHSTGEGKGEIHLDELIHDLKNDKKARKTVRLNLENLQVHLDELKDLGLKQNQISTVNDRLEEVLKAIPRSEEKWDKPWWNVEVETPKIFMGREGT